MPTRKVTLALCAFIAASFPAAAQNEEQLIARYTQLAGSEKDAQALVTGLREGTPITIGAGDTLTTLQPPTAPMGYGNIDNALALAKASLEKQGILKPTPGQLGDALNDVLVMRADSRGWGEIANSMGFRLGDLKRAERAPERVARIGRPERVERPVKPERPVRPERPERPLRPGK